MQAAPRRTPLPMVQSGMGPPYKVLRQICLCGLALAAAEDASADKAGAEER
jgi:hypothetical protein